MLKLASLCLPLALSALVLGPQDADPVTQRYHECAASGDRAALVALWKENPYAVLYTIDADLEGSLKLVESSDEPDADAIAALHARALFGASCAEEASGHPILVEYASSFVGWTAEQQRAFRGGQAAHSAARKALKAGDHATAARHARECTSLAEPLGDWWGTAMGLAAEGAALVAAGEHADALVPLTRARLIYHDLGLVGAEYGSLRDLVTALVALERTPRARTAARQALALAGTVGHEEGAAALAKILESLGE